ncbi:MAG: S41 family peptidase [Chitinophagaceae bacterium]
MTRQFLSLLFFLFFVKSSFGQKCDCETNFNWVKTTFENNDAGFQYAIDIKGKPAYESHNKIYAQKAKQVNDAIACQKILREWLAFFRAGHLGIIPAEQQNPSQTSKDKKAETGKWETVAIDIPDFEKYLAAKKEADFEGVWETGAYTIGIKKMGDEYKGFVVKSGNPSWKENEIKLKINAAKKSAIYFMGDKSSFETSDIRTIGKNYMQIGFVNLKRLSPKFEAEKNIEEYFKVIEAKNPFIIELNNTTLLFRVPSFDGSKKEIDSIISANKEKILRTENLIIDVRNNGGGSDRNYKEIIPFLYTNPIREVGVALYSTKLNNQRMLEFVSNPKYGLDENEKKWAKTSYDTLQKHIGEFVNLERQKINIDTLDTIYPYPKNVGIIINKGNGSTTEQFLLAAKQSKKVKLFGVTTAGVLDISNMYFVESPCREFQLGYSLSKSFRIPDMAIDGKGIMPDYYIDKEIQEYDWIDYVNKILNQK